MSKDSIKALEAEISSSNKNNFAADNFDVYRFGKYAGPPRASSGTRNLKRFIKSKLSGVRHGVPATTNLDKLIPDVEKFDRLFHSLTARDQALLLRLMAYRQLGYEKVKLPRNTAQYWEMFDKAKALENKKDSYDPKFLGFMLSKFDLNPIGFDIKLYFADIGIVATFLAEQYAYKINGTNSIKVENGDTVIDLGACWGDTAMYFAHKTGATGKVYSFEFIPGNIELLKINLKLNPQFRSNIHVIERPVSEISGETVYFQDNGPASKIHASPFSGQTGSTQTLTIDDFVHSKNIDKVDLSRWTLRAPNCPRFVAQKKPLRSFGPGLRSQFITAWVI